MKFTNGFWLKKKGMNIYNPMQVYDYQIREKSFTAYMPVAKIANRGNTLNCPMITLDVSSPVENVICVRAYHHASGLKTEPAFELYEDKNGNVSIEDQKDAIVLKSGSVSARIQKEEFAMQFFDGDRQLTASGPKYLGYVEAEYPERETTYMREQLDLGIGECIYGLGERFTSFVKNGQSVDIWNEDGGANSELAYKNVPFYLTSRGLSEEEATTMIVSGFIEPLVKELPMEYAVEMNKLIQLQMVGSVG